MKKIPFILLSMISFSTEISTDFTFGVSRQDMSGSVRHEDEVGVIKAVYPVVAMEGGLSYPLKKMWSTAMRVKLGGPSIASDVSDVDIAQEYDLSARWMLSYGDNSYIQAGPLWQRSKVSFGWRDLNEKLYLDGYGVAFGVYHPLLDYLGLRINFQHVINSSVHPCIYNAQSEKIGTLKTGMSQLSVALSSDLSVIY